MPRVGGLHHRNVCAEAAQDALGFTPRRRTDQGTSFWENQAILPVYAEKALHVVVRCSMP